MANSNPKCPKCHGTGWALKPGTQTQAPCKGCVNPPVKVWDDDFEDGIVGDDVVAKEFIEDPSHGW